MPIVGDKDTFEAVYMAKLKAFLAPHGLVMDYHHDRAAIDTGLNLYLQGDGPRRPSQVRVWFQAKGKMAGTYPLETFESAATVAVSVRVDHLRFWYASAQPVYLAVYVEAADIFIAEDVRDIVERHWPNGTFYQEVPAEQGDVTVHVDAAAILDDRRTAAMLRHRSMRIDGPAFRGRPLGHRFDPIRSQVSTPDTATFDCIVERLLDAHDFRTLEVAEIGSDIRVLRGRMYETLSWQSPAFAEYGYGIGDDFRIEPAYEALHGDTILIVDSKSERAGLSEDERTAIAAAVQLAGRSASLAVVFNGRDLSGTGGVWRGTLNDLEERDRYVQVRQIGLEAITFLLLVTTLVYLDLSPELSWRHVNYLP